MIRDRDLLTHRLRAPRAHDSEAVSYSTAIDTGEESIVQQQFADEVDINTIVRRFGLGQVPVARLDGVYGDFTGVHDLESAQEALERARDSFFSVPPEIREQFGNDPAAFVEYAQGKDPDELAAELGFEAAPAAEPPVLAPAAPPPPAAAVPSSVSDGGA